MNSSLLSTASSISSSHLTSANPNLNSSTSHLTSPHHPVSPPGSNLQTSPSSRPPPYIPPPNAPGQVMLHIRRPVMWIRSDPNSFGYVNPDPEVKNEGKSFHRKKNNRWNYIFQSYFSLRFRFELDFYFFLLFDDFIGLDLYLSNFAGPDTISPVLQYCIRRRVIYFFLNMPTCLENFIWERESFTLFLMNS